MTPRQLLRLILVGLGTSVVPLDTAVNIGFPDITRSFGLPIQMIQWVVICYVLTYASLMLGFGRVGDIFGHARVFRVGLAWSVAAFLLCAAAPAYGWLLFCRFLQGIGAGLVISVAPALVTGLYPETRRSRGVAAFAMIFALASASGPLIGGALVARWGWPAVFWFRAPIALVALIFYKGLPRATGAGERQPLDLAGALLLALTISSLLVGINQLPRLGRMDWRALPLFAFAAIGFYAFIRREAHFPAPIINLELFRSRSFVAVNSASVLIYFTSFSVLLFVPYYLVRTAGFSLPVAGAMLAASFVGTIAASPLAGWLVERVSAMRIGCLGALLGGAGLMGLGAVNASIPIGTLPIRAGPILVVLILAALILQGFGVGLFQVAYMDVVLGRLPQHDRGVAGSIAMATRTVGIVSGATLLTLLFHEIEAAALTAGQPAPAAFLSAFRLTLSAAGVVSILTGLAALALANSPKA
ncbi:MAG TPA: MFS transporter [Stellaceae bacterium]|nr:MFS transporter [Stellaceae bacterium]